MYIHILFMITFNKMQGCKDNGNNPSLVRKFSTVLNSSFQAVDSGFQVLDSVFFLCGN